MDEAGRSLTGIRNPRKLALAYGSFGTTHLSLGNEQAGIDAINHALSLASRLEDEFDRNRSISDISKDLADQGFFEVAYQVAGLLIGTKVHDRTVAHIVTEIGVQQGLDAILEAAPKIVSARDRYFAFVKASWTYRENGAFLDDDEEQALLHALSATKSIGDKSERAEKMLKVALDLYQAGRTNEARHVFDDVERRYAAELPTSEYIQLMTILKGQDVAYRYARVAAEGERPRVGSIVYGLIKAEKFDDAFDLVAANSAHLHENTITGAAIRLCEKGQSGKAVEVARYSIPKLLETPRDSPFFNSHAATNIFKVFNRCGNSEQVEDFSETLSNLHNRFDRLTPKDDIWYSIAIGKRSAGKFNEAMQATLNIEDTSNRNHTIWLHIVNLVYDDMNAIAILMLPYMDDSVHKVKSISHIIREQIDS